VTQGCDRADTGRRKLVDDGHILVTEHQGIRKITRRQRQIIDEELARRR